MNYEVGQPVWVKVSLWESWKDDKPVKTIWVKGVILGTFGDSCLVKSCGEVEKLVNDALLPRPTLYWSIRQWVRSLVGKK